MSESLSGDNRDALAIAAKPSFEEMLSDPSEQFDPKSELLPHVIRYLGLPPTADASALMASIEEYRNAPSGTASAPYVARAEQEGTK